jgi:hypothetical protein
MNTNIQDDMTHILYARGTLLDAADRQSAVEQMASMTSKTTEQIEQRLLSGQRKRVKSSDSLAKLMRLEEKLKAAGFDVYIDKE